MGMGPAQIAWGILGGGIWLADGAELLLVSSVTRSLQKEWHLTAVMKGLIVSAVYLGILIGNAASGGCSHRFGRREMIVLSYCGIFLCGFVSAACRAAMAFMIMRFLGGIFIGIGQPAWLSISAEITPAYWRIPMAAVSQSLFVVGEMYISFLLMMDDSNMQFLHWRVLLRLGAVPSLVLFTLSMSYLNESPMFLALKGRNKEARSVVESMGRLESSSHTTQWSGSERQTGNIYVNVGFADSIDEMMGIVGYSKVCTFVIMSVCFTLNMVYFGSLFAFPQVLPMLMHGQAASELLVGALWELPGLATGLLLGITASRHGKLMKVFLYIGYYGIKCVPNIGFIVAYQMSAELYPTEARSMGAGLALAAGRLAAMISPLIYEAVVIWTGTYLVFFLLMATMSVSNLYMVAWIISVDWGESILENMAEILLKLHCSPNCHLHLMIWNICRAFKLPPNFTVAGLKDALVQVMPINKGNPERIQAWIELGRWNPVSLLFLVPAWSYQVSGPADHWWFVARSANNMYFYAAQFCMDESGKNHVTGSVYLGLPGAVASGLQYPEANCWLAREWAPCRKPRAKRDLDRLLMSNPSAQIPYSWMDNNCQHFAVNLYEGDHGHIA
ncbi:Putative transporter svop-1 [Durusdinium trenchii]|uniref:Transporter svop-1 n=1 Tax=Durusdinium trenchii TaxID=1381693 RepID=A0ABP0HIV6_9DINO